MKIFLSFASEQRCLAEEVYLALKAEGHHVFYDKARLIAGRSYHSDIRKQLKASDAMVFLVSQDSTRPEKYTLTELEFAKAKWPNPSGKVLPVMLCSFEAVKLDPYLRAVTVLKPAGNIAAEVASAIAAWNDPKLDEAYRFLNSRNFDAAIRCIRIYLEDDFLNARANLYYAVAMLAGRNPRICDSRTIAHVERTLDIAIKNPEIRVQALRILAVVKYEYYVRNSIRQKKPSFADIIEEIKHQRFQDDDENLLSAVTCSKTAMQLVCAA